MTADDVALELLKPVLDAMRRGTKRSRLRSLTAVCREGHTVVEVFPTAGGPVALWSRGANRLTGTARTVEARRLAWLGQDPLAHAHCRCSEARNVDLFWVSEQLAAGARRVVVPDV